MIHCCFIVPVVKNDIRRVLWTVQSIRKYCSDYRIFLLMDMDPKYYEMDREVSGKDIQIIYAKQPTNGHWGRILKMQNSAMLSALRRSDISSECIFVKIDADALIVRSGLIERAQKIFSDNPKCGQIGQVFNNISGSPLLNKGWANYFRGRMSLFGYIKVFGLFLRYCKAPIVALKSTFLLRKILKRAVQNGWPPGAFAIGGAYILRLEAVRAMHEKNLLIGSPFYFLPYPGEDVILTPHLYACGYNAMDDIGPDGLFAICGKEPWVHPIDLLEQGNYIIHPIKYGVTMTNPRLSERQLAEKLLDKNFFGS